MTKLSKTIIIAFTLLTLLDTALALDEYYHLDLYYSDGALFFTDITLVPGLAEEIGDEGAYILKLVSFYNTALFEAKFDINTNRDFTLEIPYHKEAKEIAIFKENKNIFYYDISSFADVCGDEICQEHESYEDCSQDCRSGRADDYCDSIEDQKCDPDCPPSLDHDCEATINGGEEIEQEQKLESPLNQETQDTIQEENISPLIPILILIAVVLAVIAILVRMQPRNHEVEEYIKTCIKMGYSLEQIRSALLKQGYGAKLVEKFLRSFQR